MKKIIISSVILNILILHQVVSQVSLPNIQSEIRMTNNEVTTVFPVLTKLSFLTQNDKMDVNFDVRISFKNFQSDQTSILKAALEKDDDCGENLKITGSKFYEQNRKAYLTVNLRYEEWGCLLGGKTRLFRQSGSIKVRLTPSIDNSKLVINSKVVDIDANGALGSLIDNESVKRQVIELVGLDDKFEAVMPNEIASLNPIFTDFSFITDNDTISLNAKAKMLLDGEQLAELMSLADKDD